MGDIIPSNVELPVIRYDLVYNQRGRPAILALVRVLDQGFPVMVDEVLINVLQKQEPYLVSRNCIPSSLDDSTRKNTLYISGQYQR